MKTHEDIYQTNQKYRNKIRYAQYQLRRQEFIERMSNDKGDDYLLAEMAEFNLPNNLKKQAI